MLKFGLRQNYLVLWVLVGLSVVWPAVVSASAHAPHDIVRGVTDELVEAIGEGRDYYDDTPDRFYAEVDRIISPHIDYRGFSRAVMGQYGSSKYYKTLPSEEERRLFVERVNRFTGVVKVRMVETLSKGLMTFSGERIEVLPPNAEQQGKVDNLESVSVTQLIHRDADQPLRVQFKLRPDKAQQWKMINVVLNNINLGKQYRTEFSSKLREFNGDLDKVIDYWSDADVDGEIGV